MPADPCKGPPRWLRLLPAAALLCALLPGVLPGVLPVGDPVPAPDLPAADELLDTALPQGDLPDAAVIESAPPGLPAAPVSAGEPIVTTGPEHQPDAPAALLTGEELSEGGTVYFRNETGYALDAAAMLQAECPVSLGDSGVQVLIVHTHGTEAYTPTKAEPYTATDSYRTTDARHNMLRVGQLIADILNRRGIETVHSEALHDYPSYNGAYNRALKDIQSHLDRYPTIRLVLDVHRDAVGAGTAYRTAAEVDGVPTAQLMFVTGTDEGGLRHDGWRQNLRFHVQLHDALNTACPGVMRPLSVRRGRFNQHVRTGSMLVEVGANGNTLEEALAAARLFAEGLAEFLGDE